MNKPEEKARELVEKFFNYDGIDWKTAKKCALICVDQKLNAIPKLIGGRALFENPDIDFWNEVKSKIEGL
jgi:hypothetical protein